MGGPNFLVTEVSNLNYVQSEIYFREELKLWWFSRCLTMGKSSKVKDTKSSDSTLPPTLVRVPNPGSTAAAAGSVTSSPAQPKQGDMLTVLTGISGILQSGFDSLNKKVGKVSDNIESMEDTMMKRFDDLVEGSAPETDDEVVQAEATGDKKRKRQEDHDLSDTEENHSEVLTEASNALDTDDTIGDPVKDHVAAFVKKAFDKPLKGDNIKRFKDKFPLPSNIACLGVPRVNEPIFLKLSTTAKNDDRAIQSNQSVFMKVVTALVRITDTLADHESESEWVKDIMKTSTEAITLSASLKRD